MNRKRLFIGLGALGFAAIAASLAYLSHYPAAAMPFGVEVSAILAPNGSWTTVGPNPAGSFEVLPSGVPGGDVHLYFYAPYQTELKVDIDGTALPAFSPNMSPAGIASAGFYQVVSVRSNLQPAIWQVDVRPPAAKAASSAFTINVADVSLNFLKTGTDRQSNPLSVKLVQQKTFVLSVAMSGMGSGLVTSNPPGITCPGSCVFDFGQSTTVTLTPSPATSFSGWVGPCINGGENCVVTLNGTAVSVTATLIPTPDTSPLNNCPPIDPTKGEYEGPPYCPIQNAFNDPSPDIACNQQKYFCCAKSQGASPAAQGSCSPDHAEFPPSCDAGSKLESSGCYIESTPGP